LRKNIINAMSNDVPSSGFFQSSLKFLLVLALLSARCFDLDPDVLPVHDAHDVRTADRAEPVEMLV